MQSTSGPALPHTLLAASIAIVLYAPTVFAAAATDLESQLDVLAARVQQLEKALSGTLDAPSPAPSSPRGSSADTLEQKVRLIERKLEVADEAAVARNLKTPTVSIGEKGLAVASPDANFELRLRGYLQSDARLWLDDDADDDVDSLLIRRARPVFEGAVFKHFFYRIMPDFAGSSVSVQDAYVEWRQFPFAKVAVGKFKAPIGLERLASGTALEFVERGLPTNLVPNRDFGVMLNGELSGGKLSYAAGIFNGVQDLGSVGASDSSDDKDFAGRLFLQPFLDHYGPLQGLGFGLAGSYGAEKGSAAATALGSYVTQGQARFFRYRTSSAEATVNGTALAAVPVLASTTIADGDRYRLSPQGYWYWRAFGLLGEYVASTQEVALGPHRTDLTHTAWQLAGSWVLTGEEASYKGVKPRANFNPLDGRWGAFELVSRYGELHLDDDSFDGLTATGLGTAFADPRRAAWEARAWGVGLNWYFNSNFKFNLDYEQTSFDGGGGGTLSAPLDRETERVVLTRFQFAY